MLNIKLDINERENRNTHTHTHTMRKINGMVGMGEGIDYKRYK